MALMKDDPRYIDALKRIERVQFQKLADFRGRLRDRMLGRVAEAIDAMGDVFDETKLREALANSAAIYQEEGMRYVSEALVATGEIELAKKLGEIEATGNLDDLPPTFRAAFDELVRTGALVPDLTSEVDTGGTRV